MPARVTGGVFAGPCWALVTLGPAPAGAAGLVAVGRGGALAVGGGAAGGAGRAGGTVGMEVGLGIGVGRDAESGVRVGAAASVDAAGRFAAVEDTDVGFTAVIGRAALGAVAGPTGRAGAAAVPTAGPAAPALAGVAMGFVGAIATLGAPLAGVGCDGAGFGVAAEADVDAADCPAVGDDVDG